MSDNVNYNNVTYTEIFDVETGQVRRHPHKRFHSFLGSNQRENPNYRGDPEVRITRQEDGSLLVEPDERDTLRDWFTTRLDRPGDYVCFRIDKLGILIPVEAPDHVPVYEDANWEFSASGGGFGEYGVDAGDENEPSSS